MKKAFMILILLSTVFSAWSKGGRGQRPTPPTIEERIEKAKEELTLSEDQAAEWQVIFEKYEDQIQEARQNQDRKAGESLRNTVNKELLATLDEGQQIAFEKMQKNRPGRGRKRG